VSISFDACVNVSAVERGSVFTELNSNATQMVQLRGATVIEMAAEWPKIAAG
jgi:hypothetical protein